MSTYTSARAAFRDAGAALDRLRGQSPDLTALRLFDDPHMATAATLYADGPDVLAIARALAMPTRASTRATAGRPPPTFSPTHDDQGRLWGRGSGAAAPHVRDGRQYTVATDRYDYDQRGDGGPSAMDYDPDYDDDSSYDDGDDYSS